MPSGSYERESRKLYNRHKTKDSVPFSLFALRLRRGLKLKDALFKKIQKQNKIKYPIIIDQKKFKTLEQVSEYFDINYGTLISRYYKGSRGDELIKKPRIRKYRNLQERKKAIKEINKRSRIKHREKRNEEIKQWRRKNPDYRANYEKKNKARIQQVLKNYRSKNKEKRNKYNKEWRKNNKSSPNLIWETVRSRFNHWLRYKNYKKRNEMNLIIGCTPEYFKKYIQKQFKKGMNWKNHGKWHLDHIIPLANFNPKNDLEVAKACHYTNMQPLWKIENLKKNKYIR